MNQTARLRLYRFTAGAIFEGAVVEALERIEVSGDTGLLDALFVVRDAAGGGFQALDLATGRADGTVVAMLDFRLDPSSRRAATQRTLAPHAGAVPAAVVEAIADALEPGGAALAVLFTGTAPEALADAVTRTAGRMVADEPVAATTLAEAAPRLRAAL